MKIILSGFIFFVYTLQFQYSNSLVIEHVGEIDRPIATIKITDEKNDTLTESRRFYHKCIVEAKTYTSLRSTFSTAQGNLKTDKYDFGTFKCSVYDRGALRFQYFLDRKKAILLYDKLIRDLKQHEGDKEVISYLETNKKRINY